jgi:hypothetical protein
MPHSPNTPHPSVGTPDRLNMYSVLWVKPNDSNRLHHKRFSSEQGAKDYALKTYGEGNNYVIFKHLSDAEDGHQELGLIKDSNSWKYKLGLFLTSTKFVVPVILGLVVYFLVKKNNGLPRVIGG